MQVQVLLFASYRDRAGRAELGAELPEAAHVGDLLDALRAQHAAFATLPPDVAVAVNMEYARADTTLRDGDVVALIPPVAGG